MEEEVAPGHGSPEGDAHRRQAAHLYGLIVSSAVLATAPEDFRLSRVAIVLFCTLLIYWFAETYVHWIAARAVVRRKLTGHERAMIVRDGWPLVASCAVPVLVLAAEAVFRVETPVALDVALIVNAALLCGIGWQMGRSSGLRGAGLVFASVSTGLLGLAMVLLKTLLH